VANAGFPFSSRRHLLFFAASASNLNNWKELPDEARLHGARSRFDCRCRDLLSDAGRQLPSFFPGHENGLTRIRFKRGLVSGAVGVVLLVVGWWMGRR
jgi:hypothetical protein